MTSIEQPVTKTQAAPSIMDGHRIARFLFPEAVAAVLYGIAVGDALGLPVEGWTSDEIRRRHGVVRGFLPVEEVKYFPGHHPAGTTSDDTDSAIAVLKAVSRGASMESMRPALIEAYDEALAKGAGEKGYPIGWGWSMGDAITRLKAGVSWQEAGKSEDPAMGLGNGALIRLPGVALRMFLDKEYSINPEGVELTPRAVQFVSDATIITHNTDLAVAASAGFAAGLVYCLGVAPVHFTEEHFIQTVRRHLNSAAGASQTDESVQRLDRELSRLSDFNTISCEQWAARADQALSPSHILNSFPLALLAFLRAPRSTESLFEVANAGLDSDSNASMVGSLLGCFNKCPSMFASLAGELRNAGEIDRVLEQVGSSFGF